MTLYLSEQAMQRATERNDPTILALRANRLHDLARLSTNPRRSAMLSLMHKAYVLMGLAYWHRVYNNVEMWFVLLVDADEALEAARDVVNGAINVPTAMGVAA